MAEPATTLAALASFARTRSGHASAADRGEMLRRLTGLFLAHSGAVTDELRTLFDEIMTAMMHEIDVRARLDISTRLAPEPRAPRGLVRKLAHDGEIAVARPVLVSSPCLDEGDLISVALTHGAGHLLAIARREHVPARVTDTLIARGDDVVQQAVARNPGATLSIRGAECLVANARRDPFLRDLLRLRRDLPLHCLEALANLAGSAVAARLAGEAWPRAAVAEGVARAAKGLAQDLADAHEERKASRADFAKSHDRNLDPLDVRARVARLAAAGQLDDARFQEWANALQVDACVQGLARLSGLEEAIVERILLSLETERLVLACKAAGLHWDTVEALVRMRQGAGATAQAMTALAQRYANLDTAAARRVLPHVARQVQASLRERTRH